jgi:hypothetical protein
VENDPNLLMALLAVRLLGGRSVDAGAPLLKSFKAQLKHAAGEGFVQEGKTKIATMTKTGKASSKQVAVLDLTEKGEQYLRRAADPAALAATNNGYLAGMRQRLEADHRQLRAEVQAVLQAKGEGKESDDSKTTKALDNLGKQVNTLVEKVEKLRMDLDKQLGKMKPAAQDAGDSKIIDRLDQAFAAMVNRLDKTINAFSGVSRPDHQTAPAPAPLSLSNALRTAYERLCRFVEFKDGVVELPRLYHETRKTFPSLSVKEFHDELMALWQRKEVELHVLNEVHLAAEPDKGIEHNNKLYYYARWKPS